MILNYENHLTRDLVGGAIFCPPPDFSIYLQNRCADRHQTFSTLPDINFTHCDQKFSKSYDRLAGNDVRVTSFLPFSTQKKVSREELSGLQL